MPQRDEEFNRYVQSSNRDICDIHRYIKMTQNEASNYGHDSGPATMWTDWKQSIQ